MKRRRYTVAAVLAVAGFSALIAVLPSNGAGREVTLENFRFRPATIQIPVGGAITFENTSKTTHTATCETCPQDTGDVQPGMLKTLTFPRAGTFRLFCRYHGEGGMIAQLTVGRAGSSSPSPTVPSSPSPSPTAT